MSIVREYDNFLDLRRQEISNFLWVSKRWDPKIAFKQGKTRPTPQSHKEAVLKSPKIQELLEQISLIDNVSKSILEGQVRNILDEIGYEKNLKVIRWLGLVLTKMCLKVLTGIHVNVDVVEQIKCQMGNCPVIFMPTHRSYGDFIMMSYILFQYDIEIPAIASGMDFHGMWGMGTMLRETGAFFMRRSYNNDKLYWTTFRQYVHQLTSKGDAPLEFFIEGTRSRSNKSLSPKYGLLSMVLKAFACSEVPDILFVPIGMNYDRILEEVLFAYELLGVPKPKESTSGFFKSLKLLKENYGNIYVHMDRPISVKQFFGDRLDRSIHNLGALHQQELTENEKKLLPPLAHEIINRQQKVLVITVFNLVSLIINNLAYKNKLLSIDELTSEVKWIREVLKCLDCFIHPINIEQSIKDCLKVHKNLIGIDKDKKISIIFNKVSQGETQYKKLKAHALSDKIMTYSVPFVMLQIYINPVLQYFIDINIILVVLGTKPMSEDELFETYFYLRSLFTREFVTLAPKDKTVFTMALNNSISLNLITLTYGSYQLGHNEKLRELIINTFNTFYVSYYAIFLVLEILPEVTDEKSILANAQKILGDAINKRETFVHPYTLNLDSLGNCLSILVDLGILQKTKRGDKNMYEISKTKLLINKEKFGRFVPKLSLGQNCQIKSDPLQNKL